MKERGNQQLTAGNLSEALKSYTKAIELDPENHLFFSNRAAVRLKLGDWKSAVQDCEEALRIDPTFTKAQYRLAQAHTYLGNFSEAKKLVASMEEKARDSEDSRRLLRTVDEFNDSIRRAHELLNEEKVDAAASVIDELGTVLSSALQTKVLKARLLISQGRVDSALMILNGLYASPGGSDNIDILVWRGVAFYKNASDEIAKQHFQKVLRSDPDNPKALTMFKLIRNLESKREQGNSLFKDGNPQAAIQVYTEAMRIDPTNNVFNATMFSNRAAAHMRLNDWRAAANDCSESISLNPNNAKVYVRRARCWTQLSQYSDAVRDLKRARELQPGDDEIEEELRKAELAAKHTNPNSYYSILGVTPSASANDIKAAYRKLALQWHPDRHNTSEAARAAAEEKFKKITEAYDVLSDETRRRKYDLGADADELYNNQGGGGYGGFGPGPSFFRMFSGGGGRRPGSARSYQF